MTKLQSATVTGEGQGGKEKGKHKEYQLRLSNLVSRLAACPLPSALQKAK